VTSGGSALLPSRMMEPLPYCFSMVAMASSTAFCFSPVAMFFSAGAPAEEAAEAPDGAERVSGEETAGGPDGAERISGDEEAGAPDGAERVSGEEALRGRSWAILVSWVVGGRVRGRGARIGGGTPG
jgi:hypothetical protein